MQWHGDVEVEGIIIAYISKEKHHYQNKVVPVNNTHNIKDGSRYTAVNNLL
jgi:hypothetical protein